MQVGAIYREAAQARQADQKDEPCQCQQHRAAVCVAAGGAQQPQKAVQRRKQRRCRQQPDQPPGPDFPNGDTDKRDRRRAGVQLDAGGRRRVFQPEVPFKAGLLPRQQAGPAHVDRLAGIHDKAQRGLAFGRIGGRIFDRDRIPPGRQPRQSAVQPVHRRRVSGSLGGERLLLAVRKRDRAIRLAQLQLCHRLQISRRQLYVRGWPRQLRRQPQQHKQLDRQHPDRRARQFFDLVHCFHSPALCGLYICFFYYKVIPGQVASRFSFSPCRTAKGGV